MQATTAVVLAEHLPKDLLEQRLAEVLEHADSLRSQATGLSFYSFGGAFVGGFQELVPEWMAIGLAIHIPGQEEGGIKGALLTKARAHPKLLPRTFLLAGLAPHLGEPVRTEVMREALEALSEHRDELTQETLENIRAFCDSPAFLNLVENQLRAEAAVAPGSLSDEAKRLSIDQLARTVRVSMEEESSLSNYVSLHVHAILMALVPHLPVSLLPRALQIAESLEDDSIRFSTAAQALVRLPAPERSVETERVFEAAYALEFPEDDSFQTPRRLKALAALAPCLEETLWRRLLVDLQATKINSRSDRLEILASLVSHVPREMLADLERLDTKEIDESYSFSYGFNGAFGWSFDKPADAQELPFWLAKLPRVEETARRELAERVLRLIETFPVNVGTTLEQLGPWLTELELRGVLRLIRGWNEPLRRSEALKAISQHLPASLLSEALEMTGAILDRNEASEALHGLTVTLAEDGDWANGLAAAEVIPDPFLRTDALVKIARTVSGPERQRLVDLALVAGETVPEGEYRIRGDDPVECRSVAIAMTGLLLEEPARRERFRKAMEAEQDETASLQPSALARLSGALAAAGYVEWGLESALRISREDARCFALVSIAEYLDEAGRDRVLTEVSAHPEPETRARLLAWLAPYLSPVQAAQALKLAAELVEPALRIQIVAALLPSMTEKDREEHAADCLRIFRDMADDAHRAQAFSALVPHLSGERLLEARAIAGSGNDEQWRNGMRSAVAVQLGKEGLVDEALDEIMKLSQEGWRADALRQLAGFLTDEGRVRRALEIAAAAPNGFISRTDTVFVRGGKNTLQVGWSAQAAAVGAIASRAPSRLTAKLYDLFRQILQRLGGGERREILILMGSLDRMARKLANDEASAALSCAVTDVLRWWPP